VTDAAGGRTVYSYDEVGNRVSQTDALSRTTQYRHDALNRLIEQTLPGGRREQFGYDSVSNLISHTDFKGSTTSYRFDARSRPTPATGRPGSATLPRARPWRRSPIRSRPPAAGSRSPRSTAR